MPRQINTDEKYMGKLLKLIPSEIVAAYLAIQGVIPAGQAKWGLIVVSLLLLIITPLYLRLVQKVDSVPQIVLSCFSFLVWVYSLGGPFVYLHIHVPWVSSVVLILWTMFIPRFFSLNLDNNNPQNN